MNGSLSSVTLLLVGTLTACSFAPAYKTPDSVPATSVYKESGDWEAAQPLDNQDRGAWWVIFHDPQLDALESRVADANQGVKAAFARLQQARAATRIARADLFPNLSAASSATRSRTSTDSPTYVPGRKPVYNNFDLEADLSYEVDVWGRVRNAVSSARASQQASAADLATLDLSIHAELATDYFTLRSEDAQQVLLDETVADYVQSLQLTQNLYSGGGAAIADVAQAQAQLETARTQAADIRLQRAQTEHAIAVLLNENPSAFSLQPDPLTLELTPPPVNPGLPSSLLERRPDVAAAERRVAAANAQIGVARAAYFPVFSLAAAAGLDSTRSSSWLTAPSRFWSLGPAAGLLTVFDAGRHRAQSAQAKAIYEEQVADYRSTVLTAYQEVEDNLAALRQLQQESVSEAAAVTATAKALQQAQYRYKAGLVTYLEVATTENALLQAQLSNVSIQTRRMNASVLLVKALGGGWQKGEPRQAAIFPIEVVTSSNDQFWANSVIIEGAHEVMLVDAQLTKINAEKVLREVQATKKPLSIIYITHAHPDHFLGLEVFREAYPTARIIADSNIVDRINKMYQQRIDKWRGILGSDAASHTVAISKYDDSFIQFEDSRIEILRDIQGDTDPNTMLWLPGQKTLIAGDVVFNDMHVYTAETDAAARERWLNALRKIRQMNPAVVIPGHSKDGAPLDATSAVNFTEQYLLVFEEELRKAKDPDELIAAMKAKFPSCDLLLALERGAKANVER